MCEAPSLSCKHCSNATAELALASFSRSSSTGTTEGAPCYHQSLNLQDSDQADTVESKTARGAQHILLCLLPHVPLHTEVSD